jgi:hypothetical protein
VVPQVAQTLDALHEFIDGEADPLAPQALGLNPIQRPIPLRRPAMLHQIGKGLIAGLD